MTSNKIHGSQYSENCLTSPKLLGKVILNCYSGTEAGITVRKLSMDCAMLITCL